ncbi:MAG: glutamate racemase [Chloroflexi bacterium]|nr:glutamate racemase [Chloroflexota bacterium]
MSDDRPIGVFDSGLGGLTVVRHLLRLLPSESIVYLGDTARVPYGSRSPETVRKFARQDAYFLAGHGVKFIVIACNTASALAEEDLAGRLAIPVLGVIKPGAAAAVRLSRGGNIGVIGTRGTISSGSYQRLVRQLLPSARITGQPCPLFVPLAEEGAACSPAAALIAEEYLALLQAAQVDTLILGCTHYPLLEPVIRQTMGSKVMLVDPGRALADQLRCRLEELGLEATGRRPPFHRYFVTDCTAQFQPLAESFLGAPLLGSVEQVDLE